MSRRYDFTEWPAEALAQWEAIRSRYHPPFQDSEGRWICAEHSARGGLLARLIAGGEPLEHPPPLHMSRPWYSLIERGFAEGYLNNFVLPWKPDGIECMSIGQHGRWEILEAGDGWWHLRYPNHGTWRLSWVGSPATEHFPAVRLEREEPEHE